MLPWFTFWSNPWFKFPLSGNVTQDIAPVTSWFSPQLELNFAGDQKVESQVVTEVASYGKQLGLLTEAVLELAEGRSSVSVDKLRELANQIEQIKSRQQQKLNEEVRADLARLKQQDPSGFKALLAQYQAG